MNTIQKTKEIYRLTLPTPFAVGPINVYLVKGDALTLVDTGPKTEEAWKSFTKQLVDIGYHVNDIEQVVLTHHHSDHVGLIDFLPDIPVYGHWRNEPWISRDSTLFQRHDEFFTQFLAESGVVDHFDDLVKRRETLFAYSCRAHLTGELKEGDRIPGMYGWTVIETPGHAQSHISLYHEKDGILLAGDHLIKHISPNPILEPPYIGEKERPQPLLQYRASTKKCIQIPVSTVFSGHGEEITNVAQLITTQQRLQEQRAWKVREIVKDGAKTAYDICKKLFPKAYKTEMFLTMSETIGQLDYLISIGEVKAQKTGPQVTYTTTN